MKIERAGEVRFGGLAAKEEAFETEAVDVRAGPGGRAGKVGEGREEIVTDDVDRGARGGGDAGADTGGTGGDSKLNESSPTGERPCRRWSWPLGVSKVKAMSKTPWLDSGGTGV